MSTYVVSDLHGQYDVFKRGLKDIKFSASDYLYVIGDAIDRGPDGIRILREIKRRKNMDLILGNHEFMMLNSVSYEGKPICDGPESYLWLELNGGNKTFAKYKKLSVADRKALIFWLYHRDLIKTVKINTVAGEGTFTLCHSYYIPKYDSISFAEIPQEDAWDIVWRSMFRNDWDTRCENIYEKYSDTVFVTGHVPVQRIDSNKYILSNSLPEPIRVGNLLNIDGGLAFGDLGVPNAAIFFRLDDAKVFTVPLKQP